MTDKTPSLPDELDEGLAFAYGEETEAPASPSVLERIGELTGSKAKVLLRDDQAGDTPMLKPLGPDDTREAGKYVVHGELGRGGVGTVHRGHDQDLGRDVAMKFLHDKYKNEPDILHRFVEEAQIGGQLQHPGIVPVYDLGMLDGKPFFSMKLVKGQTLAKKLADRESTASDSRTFLSIFEDVCQTMAYAHARGVVHRDLKPSNIMIGSFGEVQVVDWGMGKVLQQGGVADEKLAAERMANISVIETTRSAGHGTQSIIGSVMGTPAYMPPEQARGDVELMDERSDVFALGGLLAEILTGKAPYPGQRNVALAMAARANQVELLERLDSCGGDEELVELAKLCLMPAPAVRPKSAEVVAKVVHDHLAAVEERVHEARVEAAEAKVRAASLKRTQTLGLSLTGVIAAGLFISLWFWRAADTAATNEEVAKFAAVASAKVAKENEQLAVEQTEIAERELARAVEIKTLITEMLQSVNPEQAKGADITLLKGILDTASKRLTDGAIEDELVAMELHTLTGRVYLSLGLYPEAELHFPVALEITMRLLGEDHRDTRARMGHLATLYRVQGRLSEAETLFLQELEISRRMSGEKLPDALMCIGNLANVYQDQGRYAEAEPLHLEMLEINTRVQGAEHPDTLKTMGNLAGLYNLQGRAAEAEALYVEMLEIWKPVLGEEHPSALIAMSNLAGLYHSLGRYAESETLSLQALEGLTRVLGDEHPTTLDCMGILANLYLIQGRYAESEPLLLETLEIRKRVLGEEHPSTLVSMLNLGNIYGRQSRLAEAEMLLSPTLEIMQRVLGEEHPSTLACMTSLTSVYGDQARYAEAAALALETLEVSKSVLGEENLRTLDMMSTLALMYMAQGRFAEAEPHYLQRLEVSKHTLGEEHVRTLGATTDLGLLYLSMGYFEDAAEMFEISLPLKRRVLGLQHPWTGYALGGLATAYMELGRAEDARQLKRELIGIQIGQADRADSSATVLNGSAWTLLTVEDESLRDPERALGFAKRACARARKSSDAALWAYLDTLALAHYETGDSAAAVEAQKRAIALMPDGGDPGMPERLAKYEASVQGH